MAPGYGIDGGNIGKRMLYDFASMLKPIYDRSGFYNIPPISYGGGGRRQTGTTGAIGNTSVTGNTGITGSIGNIDTFSANACKCNNCVTNEKEPKKPEKPETEEEKEARIAKEAEVAKKKAEAVEKAKKEKEIKEKTAIVEIRDKSGNVTGKTTKEKYEDVQGMLKKWGYRDEFLELKDQIVTLGKTAKSDEEDGWLSNKREEETRILAIKVLNKLDKLTPLELQAFMVYFEEKAVDKDKDGNKYNVKLPDFLLEHRIDPKKAKEIQKATRLDKETVRGILEKIDSSNKYYSTIKVIEPSDLDNESKREEARKNRRATEKSGNDGPNSEKNNAGKKPETKKTETPNNEKNANAEKKSEEGNWEGFKKWWNSWSISSGPNQAFNPEYTSQYDAFTPVYY